MFKVRLKERLFIIFFACFLAIYPPTVKYQEVQALEWAIPTVAFDTALKFLLGLLGVSITSKVLHDNVDWDVVQQDAMNYQIQKGNDAVAVGEWWEDVAKGTLNQASSCWSAFKEWVQSKFSSTTVNGTFGSVVENYFNYYGLTIPSGFSSSLNSNSVICSIGYYYENNYYIWAFSKPITKIIKSGNSYILSTTYGRIEECIIRNNYYNFTYRNDNTLSIFTSATSIVLWGIDNISNLDVFSSYSVLNELGDNIFDTANENIQDTAITTDDTTSTAIPDTIPLPWDNVSDTAEGVSDAIDAVQELVAEGVISLEEYWERVQELVNALAIDTTTEETLPVTRDPDTGETEKLPDKVEENVSNVAFTLNGLEKVFPFCIPWDIYAFVTLLVAEPVAPVINYPIYNPVTNEDINITIDFSDWETVVVLFRYILDFLLIIGLLLLARQLSGAGGDD